MAQPQPEQESPEQQQSPTQRSFPVLIGSVLAIVGIVLAGFGIAILIWQHRCKSPAYYNGHIHTQVPG